MSALLYPFARIGSVLRSAWFVFLIVVGICAMLLPVGRVEAAWVVPGDPSDLTTTTAFDSSCSIQYSGTINVQATGGETVAGVCSWRNASSPMALLDTAIGSGGLHGPGTGAGQIFAFQVCEMAAGPGCGGNRLYAANFAGYMQIQSGSKVERCVGVSNCFTFEIVLNASGAAAARSTLGSTSAFIIIQTNSNITAVGEVAGSKSYAAFGQLAPVVDPLLPPPYYWSVPYVMPPESPCVESVTLGYTINGENIDIVEAMETTVMIDDRLIVKVTIGDGAYPDDLDLDSFAWRKRPGTDWVTLRSLGAVITPPILGINQLLSPVPTPEQFPLDLAELRCVDDEGTWYLDGGNNWEETAKENRACYAISALLPRDAVSSGDTFSARYVLGGTGPYVGGDVWVDLRFGTVDEVTSWTVYGTQIGGDTPFLGELRVDAPLTGDLRIVAPEDMVPAASQLYCTDSVGEMRLPGDGIPRENGWTVNVGENRSCYDGAGMGLAPSTWIRGFARMGGCLAEELVVPEGDVISDVAAETMQEVEDVPPFSFFITATVFVDTAQDSFENPSGSGCLNLGGMVPGVTQDNFCVGAAGATTSPQRSIIALLLAGGIYLSILMHGVSLVREK